MTARQGVAVPRNRPNFIGTERKERDSKELETEPGRARTRLLYRLCTLYLQGVLRESYVHSLDIWLKEVWTAPTSRTRRCPNAAPADMPLARCPLRPEMAALASCATPTHASLMVSSTMDDHLAVHDDANSLRSGKQLIPAMALQATGHSHRQTGVGGTQSMVLSGAITCLRYHQAVPRIGQGHMHTRSGRRARFCRRRLTAGAAQRATRLAVRRGFQGTIEADT